MTTTPPDAIIVRDGFADCRRRGHVVGTPSSSGTERRGNDQYRSMSVDRDGLRISSLRKPGWGSTVISYGPVAETANLVMGAWLLNGHNTAQSEPLGEPVRTRFKRWLQGNESESWKKRAWVWLVHGRKIWTMKRFAHWTSIAVSQRRGRLLLLDENLSVGLLPRASGGDPLLEGNSFVMHAVGPSNGELWVADAETHRRCLPAVQNVPLYLFIVRSGDQAIHFAGSISGTGGLPALPDVRPLAIVPWRTPQTCYATVQQAVSGQIGFAADTRVFDVVVASLPEWSRSVGAPAVVHRSSGLTHGSARTWRVSGGAGLIHLRADSECDVTLGWRGHEGGEWLLSVASGQVELFVVDGLVRERIAACSQPPAQGSLDLQITDDGRSLGVHLGPKLIFDGWIVDHRHSEGEQVRIDVRCDAETELTVYRRTVSLPESIRPRPLAELAAESGPPLIEDCFDSDPGPLHERRVPGTELRWQHSSGCPCIEVTSEASARVITTPEKPLVGRSVYTMPYNGAAPVELEIDVIPPGTGRNEGQRGRAGVIFQQDARNALVVATWLDDHYAGSSISSFFLLNGYEDLYDAIWTNVGERVTWGTAYKLGVAFDGSLFTASVDDEVVLYRRLTDVHPDQSPLTINRVGIVANWEWGTDTGSTFQRFTARPVRRASLLYATPPNRGTT